MPNRPEKKKEENIVPFNERSRPDVGVPTTIDELFTCALVATVDMQATKDYMEEHALDAKGFRNEVEAFLKTMGFPEEGINNSEVGSN